MKLFKDPNTLAVIYLLSSVVLGPLLFLLGLGFTRGGGDYCDSVYRLPNGGWDPSRITEFQNAQLFQVTGACIMLVVGLTILTYMVIDSRKNNTNQNLWLVLGALLMMLGYIAVILMSGKGGQGC